MLKSVLNQAKHRFTTNDNSSISSAESILVDTIGLIENSGWVNAGVGCALTCEGTAELDASFASIRQDLTNGSCVYASVASVPFESDKQISYHHVS